MTEPNKQVEELVEWVALMHWTECRNCADYESLTLVESKATWEYVGKPFLSYAKKILSHPKLAMMVRDKTDGMQLLTCPRDSEWYGVISLADYFKEAEDGQRD